MKRKRKDTKEEGGGRVSYFLIPESGPLQWLSYLRTERTPVNATLHSLTKDAHSQ